MMNQDVYCNGEWISGYGAEIKSHNPANGEVVWKGASASLSDVGRCFIAARKAFLSWKETSLDERIKILENYREQLKLRRGQLKEAICKEMGKPLWDAEGEVNAAIAKIDLSITAYRERCPTKEGEAANGKTLLHHLPYGVMGVLGPYNFPLHLPNGHIVPAILAGNCVVFKPSEYTPSISVLMIQCWEEAGVPKGVLNLVQGKGEVGKALVSHPELDGLLFTGSAATGKQILSSLIETPGKLIALEMGGNNPLVVADVEDTEAAAYNIIQSAFITSGQRCTCARRLILVGEQEPLIKALIRQTSNLVVGSYNSTPAPFMGPVTSEAVAVEVESAFAVLLSRGAKQLVKLTPSSERYQMFSPGILDVTEVAERPDEEYFGPMLQVIHVANLQQAIAEANRTRYGLTAGLLSDKAKDWEVFYRQIRTGVIHWNTPTTGASSANPFGGLGDSGNLRPSAYYAADYCAYPCSTIWKERVSIPAAQKK